jgi:hypothetical protein
MKPARKNGGRNSIALDEAKEADATGDGGVSADAGKRGLRKRFLYQLRSNN